MAGKAQCVIGSTNLIQFPFIYESHAFIKLYLVGMGRTSGGQTGTAGYKPQLQKLRKGFIFITNLSPTSLIQKIS